jgi:ubiquinone biosynthesis protein UbiJ
VIDARAAAAIANHLLRDDAWACTQLSAHAGKSFRLALPPLSFALRIGADGSLESVPAASGCDLQLTLPATALPLLLAGREAMERAVDASGDTALAETLRELADAAPMFVERELARATGPIVARRVAETMRALAAWPAYAGEHLARSVATFLQEEQPMLLKRADLDELTAATACLCDDVARLEQRLDRVSAHIT